MFWHLKTAVNESVLTHPPMCWNQRVPTCRMSQFLLMGQRLKPWRLRAGPTVGDGMKPYYQDDHAIIYHGDCREVRHKELTDAE